MKSYKLTVLLLFVSAAGVYKKTHAEFVAAGSNNTSGSKETKAVIELNKDITVNTGLNLDKTLAQLKLTEASNTPKSRKVSPTTTGTASQVTKLPTEAGEINIKQIEKNFTESTTTAELEKRVENKISNITQNGISINNTVLPVGNHANNSGVVSKQDNNTDTMPITTTKSTTTTTAKPTFSAATNFTTTNVTKSMDSPLADSNSLNKSSTTTAIVTTTTKATTPKPKKPTVTYSIPDFPDLEKDNPDLYSLLSASNKLPIPPDAPYAQPSQEFSSNFHRGRDFIVPIVSMIFIIPLVIGILITSYRRFRDCWSTRHYRRMDFLVDGMYND